MGERGKKVLELRQTKITHWSVLPENITHLKAFCFGCTPELIKMFNPVINRVQNDEGEKAVIQSFFEGFQHAVTVSVLHLWLVLVL